MKRLDGRRRRGVRAILGPRSGSETMTTVVRHQGIVRRPRKKTSPALPLSDRQRTVLDAIGEGPVTGSQIARKLSLGESQVQSVLYALASRGVIEKLPGRRGFRRA